MSYGLSVGVRLPFWGNLVSFAWQGGRARLANSLTECGIHRLRPVKIDPDRELSKALGRLNLDIDPFLEGKDLMERGILKLNKEKSCYFTLFGVPLIKCSLTKTIRPSKLYKLSKSAMNGVDSYGYHHTRYGSIFKYRIPGLRHLVPLGIKSQTVYRCYEPPERLFSRYGDRGSSLSVRI